MLCGNCPRLDWPDGAPADWVPRPMCCIDECEVKRRELANSGPSLEERAARRMEEDPPFMNRKARRAAGRKR